MKKICCLIIAFMVCISTVAFADDYELLSASYNSYEADVSFTLTVNEPMTVLGLVSEMIGADDFLNLQMLAENLCNSESTGVIKLNSSGDYSSGKASYEIFEVVPFSVNRNFKIVTEMKVGMWIEWDISDEMNPTFKYIMQHPFTDKYISVDLIDMLEDSGISVPNYISMITGYFQKDYIDDINAKTLDILRRNSSLETWTDKVTITLTKEQFESFIADFMDFMIDEFDDNEDYDLLSDGDAGYISDILPDSEEVKEFFKEVSLFDETALVIVCTKTSSGDLKAVSSCVNMDINIRKIMDLMGWNTEGFSEDSSNIKFSLKSDTAYKSVNGNVKVEFPAVSEDDIIDFSDLLYQEYEYIYEDWDTEYCWHDENYYLYGKYIPSERGSFYSALPDIINEARHYGYKYDLSIDGDYIVISETSGKDVFTKAEMTIGSKEIKVDGQLGVLSNPVIISDGLVYVDNVALEYIFGFEMEYVEIDLENNLINVDFLRHSPQCHHTEEEINGWYDDEYEEYEEECDHYQLQYVSSGEMPYEEIKYIKIRDILDDIWSNCEVNYENNVLTLTDETGSSGFTTFVITMGSNEYVVDGVTKEAGMPALEYKDSVYVDADALVDIFGFQLITPHLIYSKYYDEEVDAEVWLMSYDATLLRKSPLCPHTDEELADYNKWWE